MEKFPRPEKIHEYIPIENQANYMGNWTLLQKRRLQNPTIKERYIRKKLESIEFNESVTLNEDRNHQYLILSDEYDKLVEEKNGQTEYISTEEANKRSTYINYDMGYFDPGSSGTVFTDGRHYKGGPKVTDRQKDLIDSHEKFHAIFWGLTQKEKSELRAVFNQPTGQFLFGGYHFNILPDEYLARMAELKNYFGFSGDEIFTKEHLEYAREHYVKDVGFDNAMSEFLHKFKNDEAFIKLMNEWSC
jgi:hypothetical protein